MAVSHVFGVIRNHKLELAFITFVLYVATWLVYALVFHPLADVPGPLLGKITRLWYVTKVKKGNFDKVALELHARYGPCVRICPNEVSISDPEAVKIIYNIKSKFYKTDFYTPWRAAGFKTTHPDQFTDLDDTHHTQRRRILGGVYSMSSILDAEPYIDACSQVFMTRLREFAEKHESCDLGEWMQMYAFDVIGELFFSRMFGFMETASDYENYIGALDVLLPALLVASILPIGTRTLYLMSGMFSSSVRKALPVLGSVEAAAKKHIGVREEQLEKGDKSAYRRDLLAKLFELRDSKGAQEDFELPDIQQEAYVAMFAGSDTTAIALRAVLYQCMTNPEVCEKLVQEIDDAAAKGALSFPCKYADATKLPYFMAVCKEAMRLHPSVGLHLPRHVPDGGIQLAGRYFSAGCRVGVNPAVVHRDTSIFGGDAKEFRPERWFDSGASNMERYLLTFGSGTRTCIGKNISLAEIHKLLPQMLRLFRFELKEPKTPLVTKDFWFNKQSGLNVKVHVREEAKGANGIANGPVKDHA